MLRALISLLFICLSFSSFSITKINGAGASFPYPIYSKWFSVYKKIKPNVQINYQAIGSGGGIRQLIKQTVDFGASDAPMKDKDMKKTAWPVMHVPTVLGAVTAAYNLPGVNNIQLDGKTLADIFQGKITKWNDPAIVGLNSRIKLPAKSILVVRRADGSGTTAVFSDYLSKVSPSWKKDIGAGKTLRWPTGIGAKGNDGVTGVVKQTEGSIGYIELAYAYKNKLPTIAIKNLANEFITPSIEGISKSAAAIKDFSGDLRVSITNAAGAGVYPISSFTYILLPLTDKNPKLKDVKEFLRWALTKGQDMTKELHYAPLPQALAKVLLTKLK